MQSVYLPIHMSDPDRDTGEFSHISVRDPGRVLARGRLRLRRSGLELTLPRSVSAQVRATADVYVRGVAALVEAHADHPVIARVLRATARTEVRVEFMERNDRVLRLYRAAGKTPARLLMDATWADIADDEDTAAAALFAGLMLLGTLSLLPADASQRTGIYRVFDLHRLLLDEAEQDGLQTFLRRAAVDCGHVFANAFRCIADDALAVEQDGVDPKPLDHVDTEALFEAGLTLERLRFDESGAKLRQAVWRQVRDTCGPVTELAHRRGEDAQTYADRVLHQVESVLKWRDKWTTWVRMQDRLDFPYPQDYVISLLDREWEDIDEKRATVNQEVSRHYDFDTEGENIHRITAWASDNDIRLVAGRLSRAFGNQAHLLSTARYVVDKSPLLPLAARIERDSRGDEVLHTAATRVLHLVQELKHTPYARLVGTLNAFDDTLVRHQAKSAQRILDEADQASRHLLSRSSVDVSRRRLAGDAERVEKLLQLSARLRKALDDCPKRPAAYVLQLQRLHPGESINLANANAFREVHSGKEEDLKDLLRQGGDYIYSAPGQGRYERNGQTIDTHWIIEVNDWIEAIPLFIKERVVRREIGTGADAVEVESIETEVDQEAMEAFFRIHAEYWARNLDAVMDAERVAVARQILVDTDARARKAADKLLADDPAMGRDEAGRQVLAGRRDAEATARTIAELAVLVEASEDAVIETVHEAVEREALPRRQALHRVLTETDTKARGNAVGRLLDGLRGNAVDAVAAACARLPKARRQRLDDYAEIALRRTRPVSALHVLTTESAGMTEGYVQTWIEEEMALANVVRAHGLQDEVRQEVTTYRKRLYEIGRRVIDDLGMGVVVEEVMADERFSPQMAVGTVVGSYRPVAEQVGVLGALLSAFGDADASLDHEPIRDIAAVETYLREHGDALSAAAAAEVAANNGHAFEERLEAVRQQRPDLDEAAARRVVIDSEVDYKEEFASTVRCRARVAVLEQLDRKHPELHLAEAAQTFVRTHAQMGQSTARKRVIARRGLQAETSDPRYYYQATGGNKRYHLLYTPSRVNLGHRERDSVVRWSQWVGGADAAAAQAGFEFYSLVNEGGVEERPALAYAEIQKTAENGLAVTHFAGSNALALLCMSVREGDVQDMGDQMNLREDRTIVPAGEGYGGYCVPKDGLFLAFVLSLTNQVKLRQMGVPDALHDGIMALARKALSRKGDYETEFAWQRWAAGELLQHDSLGQYLGVDAEDRLVFHVTKIARALENLGRPWLQAAPGHRMVANLAADWAVQKMVVHAEQVNRFMVFYKAWCIYDGLRQAREKWPACPADGAARINVSAEYKPVQDVRFSTGLRLLEIFAKTGEHLHYALDEEGQNLVHLIFSGFDPDAEDPVGQRAAQQVMQTLHVHRGDAEAMARLRAAFPGHPSPADVVVTSVSMSSTNDMLFYTSDARLDEIANRVQVQLGDYGLTEDQIRANCEVYGGDLRRWAGISHLPAGQVDGLVDSVGGAIHALVLKLRGPGRAYERDVQGVDVLNTGIPFPELLELVQDPPKLVALMLQGNPNSALVLADGCAGRVPRALTEYDIQAWFAACERFGRRGTYTGIGLGQRNVERLEADMHQWRQRGQRLLEALVAVADADAKTRRGAVDQALSAYDEVQRLVIDNDEAGKALRVEQRARRYGKWTRRDAYISQARVKVASGLPLGRLDVGTWIAGLGGAFALMGEEGSRVEDLLQRFAAGVAAVARARRSRAEVAVEPFGDDDIAVVRDLMLRPAYHPDPARFTQQKLIESSSKAVEIAAVEALERRRALRVRAEKAKAMSDRETGFGQVYGDRGRRRDGFDTWESLARTDLEAFQQRLDAFDPAAASAESERSALHVLFGRVIACTRGGLEALSAQLWTGEAHAERLAGFRADLERILAGREIVLEDWKRLAGGYEDIGGLARLAQTAAERGDAEVQRVARGMELYYTVFALGQTLQFAVDDPDAIDARVLYKNLTDFFAETINDHWYPYAPWCFDRGTAFDDLSPEALYQLSSERHAWLYRYIRTVLVRCTDLRQLPAADVDALLGRVDGDAVHTGIGAGAETDAEARWRAYNQLRELCFMHSDGFPTPPVFAEFDPELIRGFERVNVVFLYPVGRTHVSRALREAPTLNRLLEAEGRRGANLLITRYGEAMRFDGAARDQLGVRDAHLYVDRTTYVAALQRHRGLSADAAEAEAAAAEARGALTAKGIRIAARFVRDGQSVAVPVGSLIPFHGLPVYDSGRTEDMGLPATVQSLVYSDVTYDKSLYPQIFTSASGVHTPPEIDWLQEYGDDLDEATTKERIAEGVPGTDYTGLATFAAEHTIVLIKGAAESGARNLKVFDLQDDAGRVDEAALAEAVDFLYDVSRRQSVVVQTAILTSPEFWASPELMQSFVDRQVLDWNTAVQRGRLPRSQIYGSLRVIATAPDPDTAYDMAFPIFLASLQVATNVGRGGTLEKLLDEFVQERYRAQIRPGLEAEARKVMAAMAAYAPGYEPQFQSERGRPIGADARGVSYAWPPYLMLDFLVSPVFDRPGRLVDIEPVYDEAGRRTGSVPVVQDETGRHAADIVDWQFVHLEPNVGIGLWDRFNLREEVLETRAAAAEGRDFDWERVGTSDRVVLRNFVIAGEQYLDAVRG